MHERRHRGHHHQHHGGQRVDAQRPVDLEVAGGDPVEQRDAGVVPVEADLDEGDQESTRTAQQRRGDELGSASRRSIGDLFFAVEARMVDCGVIASRRRRAGAGMAVARRQRIRPAMMEPSSGRKTIA